MGRVKSIDALRVISILAVVLIHTSTRILEAGKYNLDTFALSLFLTQIARFAVPLFFLISGFALELNYKDDENLIYFYKKRLSKILVPYFFWSLFYYVLVYTKHSQNFLEALIYGGASYQLYFISALLIFYLIFPILHKLYRFLTNQFVLIILLATEIILLYHDYHIHDVTFFYPLRVFAFNFFVFIAGMFASHNQDKILRFVKRFKYLFLITVISMAVFLFFQGRNTYLSTYNINAFYSQWRPSVLIYTLVIFPLLFFVFERNLKYEKLIHTLSNLSFSVYFVHIVILEIVWKYLGGKFYTLRMFDLIFFMLVAGASFGVFFLINKR